MRPEGHMKENLNLRGSWHASFLHAILDHEWESSHGDTDIRRP
jgi:RimJ/RimL family protein N-acetyltransferase